MDRPEPTWTRPIDWSPAPPGSPVGGRALAHGGVRASAPSWLGGCLSPWPRTAPPTGRWLGYDVRKLTAVLALVPFPRSLHGQAAARRLPMAGIEARPSPITDGSLLGACKTPPNLSKARRPRGYGSARSAPDCGCM